MKNKNVDSTTTVTDLSTASFLHKNGLTPSFDLNGKQVIFRFDHPNAKELIQTWHFGNTPERNFYDSFTKLRSAVKTITAANSPDSAYSRKM